MAAIARTNDSINIINVTFVCVVGFDARGGGTRQHGSSSVVLVSSRAAPLVNQSITSFRQSSNRSSFWGRLLMDCGLYYVVPYAVCKTRLHKPAQLCERFAVWKLTRIYRSLALQYNQTIRQLVNQSSFWGCS